MSSMTDGRCEETSVKLLRYELRRGGDETDWEVELGVVIGRGGKYIHEEDALGHVAGYCAINDLFERAFQLEGTGQ